MDNIVLQPSKMAGEIVAPPSKSAAHRALICAALSCGAARVSPISTSADMEATLRVLSAMGAHWVRSGETVSFLPHSWLAHPAQPLDCGESGSTLRFLMPVAAVLGIGGIFIGSGRLPERPLDALAQQLREHGVSFSAPVLPLTLGGRMSGGRFTLPGNVSSQFISGLLLALALLPEGGEIEVRGALQSEGYVQMTLTALAQSGVQVQQTALGWRVPGGQNFRTGDYFVEGDYSNAAFWLCAGALACPAGERLTVNRLAEDSVQGDRSIVALLAQMGAQISRSRDSVSVKKSILQGCRIDAGPVPDLIPVLAVTAAFADGETSFYNAARLRIKESDRIASTAALVRALGGEAREYPDELVVKGTGKALAGGEVDGCNDHRIVMAAAVAAVACTGRVSIKGARAVEKSYPDFFIQYSRFGGVV